MLDKVKQTLEQYNHAKTGAEKRFTKRIIERNGFEWIVCLIGELNHMEHGLKQISQDSKDDTTRSYANRLLGD